MRVAQLFQLMPLLFMLSWAAVEDLRTRRIRNWLSLSVIISGLGMSFLGAVRLMPWHLSVGQSFLGFLAGFALPFLLFALGALGGGDVKLLAGVGAWVGAFASLQVFCVAAVVGMLIVLGQAAYQRRLGTLSRNSAMLAINLAHLPEVGLDHAKATGQSTRSVEKPLPYAVPILIAVLALTLMQLH